ncbi:long-chain fatty acid-CoA ligase [Rhizina undulata]
MATLKNQQTLFPCISHKPPFNLQVPNVEKKKGEGIPRRHPSAIDGLKSRPEPDIATTYDIVIRGAKKFEDQDALGSRKLINTHEETKILKRVIDGVETEVPKKWTYFEMSGYSYISFKQYADQIHTIGAGLRSLGLVKDDRLQIFAATSAKWLAMSHGAASQSMPIVTAYDTLGQVGLTHSLVMTEAKAIFLDPHLLLNLLDPLKEAREVKYVIYNNEHPVKHEDIEKLKSTHERLKIISFDDLMKLGEENPVDPVPPGPEDLCGIMYTSGSTGTPKGVPLLHKNVVAAVTGVTVIVGPYIGPGDFLLTFLPLAHILEYVFENACLFWGGTMGYGSPKTLADKSMRNCKGDIAEFRPTVLVGVPAVWETVKKGIEDKVAHLPGLTQKLFWGAMALKNFLLNTKLPGVSALDAIVFKKVKEATGGRLRVTMNGGGPIAKDTQHFLSMVICPMIIGYGLTETSAMGALMDPMEWTIEAHGTIPASIEIKLVDFEEANYFTDNNPEQGEIWIRGDPVASSYFKDDEETAKAFNDGWFMTGDIGEWDANGHLKIIDRKKNLVKTLNGEYIALEKLESIYRSCPVVGNICVYADQSKAKPVAIIVPVEGTLKKLSEANGIEEEVEQLIHNSKVQSIVLKELLNTGRKGGLAHTEMLQGVVMADEEWTPQNSFVTSAQKLNRRKILETFRKEIDHAYATGS